MEIVKIKIEALTPYENNAKEHPREQIEQIKKSIQDYGMNDPLGVWGENNIIVEGHGRYLALKEMGYKEVDCIRLDHLTDEERRAYTLVHNKLTMNTDFDFDKLEEELTQLTNFNIDITKYGFDELNEFNHIEDLLQNDFAVEGDREGKSVFGVTFVFPIEKKELIQEYIKVNGKEVIANAILEMIEEQL